MPKLSIPSLSVRLHAGDVNNFVSPLIASKGFDSFVIEEQRLVFHPFILLELQSFSSKKNNVVSDDSLRLLLFDSVSFSVSEKPLSFFDSVSKNAASFEVPEAEMSILKPKSSNNILKKIALIKSSKLLNARRDNLTVVREKHFYLPFWDIIVSVENTVYDIRINAFTKEVLFEKIPEKHKAFNDLFFEVLGDLAEPSKWLSYVPPLSMPLTAPKKRSQPAPAKAPAGPRPPHPLEMLENPLLQLGLLLIILLILMLVLVFS